MSGYASTVSIGGVELSSLVLDPANRKKNATILKAGYTPAKRRFEVASFTAFVTLEGVVAWHVWTAMTSSRLWVLPAMLLLAEVVTDFVSGLSHWACDTWGQLDTPVVGPTFIRSFREHHVDPTAMCNHDFIETNADPSLFSVVLNLYLLGVRRSFDPTSTFDACLFSFALFGGFFAAFTNQFHKWSHAPAPPAWVAWLQRWWLVLPRRHHAEHHRPPFDRTYCITTGHLNGLLDAVGFWRVAEMAISSVTGARPREDDRRWTQQIYAASQQQPQQQQQ